MSVDLRYIPFGYENITFANIPIKKLIIECKLFVKKKINTEILEPGHAFRIPIILTINKNTNLEEIVMLLFNSINECIIFTNNESQFYIYSKIFYSLYRKD